MGKKNKFAGTKPEAGFPMLPRLLICAILIQIIHPVICNAQLSENERLVHNTKTFFEDDFSRDTVGKFPSDWHISTHADSVFTINKQVCADEVKKQLTA